MNQNNSKNDSEADRNINVGELNELLGIWWKTTTLLINYFFSIPKINNSKKTQNFQKIQIKKFQKIKFQPVI